MSLSADGRYYHGKSKKDGYVFVEIQVADNAYKEWNSDHPRASAKIRHEIEALNYSANFWDLVMLDGVTTVQEYIVVERNANNYHVQSLNRGRLIWDYWPTVLQLQRWITLLSRLVQTSTDLCGIYAMPEEAILPLWNVSVEQ